MRPRRLLFVSLLLILIGLAAAGYFYFKGSGILPQHAAPPSASATLNDPAVIKIIEQYRQKVQTDPTSSTAWGELGMVFDIHYETKPAIECYRQAMKLDDKDARWPYLLASKLDRSGGSESDEAIRLFQTAVDVKAPSQSYRTVALLSLADLLTELGRGDEAAPLYEKAYSADLSNAWAAYRMAMLLFKRGESDRAARIMFSLAPNPQARKKSAVAMAEISRKLGKVKDAEGFDYAAGLLPPDENWANPFTAPLVELRRGRRALMDRFGQLESAQSEREAVKTANALADQYPSVETQIILLRSLVGAGEYPAAVAVADDILRDENGKQLVNAHSFLGLARLGLADRAEAEGRKGETDRLLNQAVEALRESVRLKPDFALGYIYLSKALLRLGKLPEAEAAARSAMSSRPEEWEGYLSLVDVLAAAGRKPEAMKIAEQAIKLAHPNEPRPKQALENLKK
ncbi:MAG: tetratricopeptide repeat protein [Gemmataceae bacterium]